MKISVAPLLKQPYGATEEYDLGEEVIAPHSEHAGLLDVGVRRVRGGVTATHTNPGVYVEGDVDAALGLECSRCLDRFEGTVSLQLSEQYYATIDVVTGARLEDPPRDAYTIGHDFVIDFTPLLREHILLEVPLKPLCREACAGICPVCGIDQNEQPHRHEAGPDERWSGLRTLLAGFKSESEDTPR